MAEPPEEPQVRDRFIWQEGEATVSQCISCARKYADLPGCQAFPAGIPLEILTNEADHTKPFDGDRGLQYKSLETII